MIVPTPLQRIVIEEMCAIAKQTYARGWNAGTAGNFSVCYDRVVWMSPSGVCKGEMNPEHFVPIDRDTLHNWNPIVKPSDESALHAALYRNFPKARCVVHVHAPGIVRQSMKNHPSVFAGQEMQKALGVKSHETSVEMWVIPNTQDIEGLAKTLIFPASSPSHLVLRGHGVYAWAAEPYQALATIEALEFLCLQNA